MNKWIESDWVLRISSVVIAIILWLIVNNSFPFQQENQTTIQIDDVQVKARYNRDQYTLTYMSNRNVQLTLSGNKKALASIPSYQVFVDLHDLKPGNLEKVNVQVSGLPKDVKVKVSPATITVKLEEKVHREMPVVVDYQGSLPEGVVVDQVKMDPDRVLVKGTESQLKKIKAVRARVNLGEEEFSLNKWVKLQAFDKNGPLKGIQISPETVHLVIKIRKSTKTLPLTVQIMRQPPDRYRVDHIEWEPATVTLSGPKDVLKNISKHPPVMLDLSKTTGNQTLTIDIPVVNREIEVTPKQVKVKVYIVGD